MKEAKCKLIVGITGFARAGKSVAASYLSKRYGLKHLDFYRDVLVEELKKRNMPLTKRNASRLGSKLRAAHGQGVLAEKLAQNLHKHEKVVVSGLRSLEEADVLSKHAEKFYIVEIRADLNTRFQRAKQTDPTLEFDRFAERDSYDSATKGMKKLIAEADFVVKNDGSLTQLYSSLDKVMKNILKASDSK
jgi:dephospho-CoA kinase